MRPRRLPDHLKAGLKIVFVGINPGLISATLGHYYANPRNPFWRLLYESSLTPVRLTPAEDARLHEFGYGLTDIVKRPSRGVGDLARREFHRGKKVLEKKLLRARPLIVCFNSKSAFVGFFGRDAFRRFGRQRVRIGTSRVYVLPSTSPANAGVALSVKRRYFRVLKKWVQQTTPTIICGGGATRYHRRVHREVRRPLSHLTQPPRTPSTIGGPDRQQKGYRARR